ncbi:MAG: flagellar assembly protein FliW [Polyangiaceae bacterium]
MLTLKGTRFGDIEVERDAVIHFERGLMGFPRDVAFVLLEWGEGRLVGYLQSVTTPGLCFPVVDGSLLGPGYPTPASDELAARHGLDPEDVGVLVIVAVRPEEKCLRANALAPLVIDLGRRRGVQAVLDHHTYEASEDIQLDDTISSKPPAQILARRVPEPSTVTTGV